ncbi:hypothetical protein [Acidocella sp. MX-AZ02]|uniref:hypothetical protein n=1 Tax=Acidocella sp. MX-AZ02 TaxID=1214225 RepID=UPI00028D844E|nr:hypothetical protein [Acidocella sp. MX-AZ02]EKM99392.1 hypothetical protein MXAZACID_10643 [Acidocella sp. MX-AZ02]
MADSDTPSPLAAGQIEIWKKIVDVQQHFNDLELRIRNFALIITGAFLGMGGYAITNGGIIKIFGIGISIAGLVVFSAILPLLAFYFMDRLWYHRLLQGSVQAGIDAETALKDLGYKVDLGSEISAKSPFKLWVFKAKIRSGRKMDIFYCTLIIALLVVACVVGFGLRPQLKSMVEPTIKAASSGAPAFSPASGMGTSSPCSTKANTIKPKVTS